MKPPEIKRINPEKLRIKETGNYCKKVYFGTQKDADEYIAKLQKTSKRDKVPVNSYLCERCKCWHLTSWTQLDIDKVLKEQDEKINDFIVDYNFALDDYMKWFRVASEEYQKMIIENHNLKYELAKLQKQLKKYEQN